MNLKLSWILFSIVGLSLVSQTVFANEHIKVRLKWFHSFQFAGYYAAVEKGFYAEENLRVELLERDPSVEIIDEVVRGDVQYGVSDGSLVLASMQGQPVTLVSQIFQHSPLVLLTREGSGLKTPKDLIGQRVAGDFDGVGDATIKAMLSKELGGLDAINRVPFEFQYDELKEGGIDAITAYRTDQPLRFERDGIPVNIIDPRHFGIDFYGDNLFTSHDELYNHPTRVEAFRRATLKGWQYALSHSDEVIEIIQNRYDSQNLSQSQLQFEAQETIKFVRSEVLPIGSFDVERYRKMVTTYEELDLTQPAAIHPDFFYHPFLSQLTTQELQWLGQRKTISVGVMQDWPPFDFVDSKGEPQGIGIDFLTAINKRIGYRLTPEPGVWSDIYNAVQSQQLDALMDITPKPSREPFFNFTDPYLRVPHAIIRQKGSSYVNNETELNGYSLALEEGFGNVKYFNENFPEIEIKTYQGTVFALEAVSRGEVDAYVGNRAVASYLINREVLINLEVQGRLNRAPTELAIGVRKDWTILRSIFQKALESLSDAERNAVLAPWLSSSRTVTQLEYLLNQRELAWLEGHRTVKIRLNAKNSPMSFVNDSEGFQGILIDYLRLLGSSLDIRFEMVSDEEREPLDTPDGVYLTQVTSNADSVDYVPSNSILSIPVHLFARREDQYINSLESIESQRIAIVKSDRVQAQVRKDYPRLDLVLVDTPEEGFELLDNKKVDAYMGDLLTATYHMHKLGLTEIWLAGDTPYTNEQALMIPKQWPIFNDIVRKSLNSIPQYQHESIFNRWMSVRFEQRINYQLLWQVVFGALVLLALILFWIRRLSFEIAQRKTAERQLLEHQETLEQQVADRTREYSHLAQHDALTGLINRYEFERRVQRLMSSLDFEKGEHALCFMDLDQFKVINDTSGHVAGDELLRQIGKLLTGLVRKNDTLARLGGDEFAVLMEHCSPEQAQRAANAWLESIQDFQFFWEGNSYRVGASIGLVAITPDIPNFTDLLKLADSACYMAKDLGRNRIHIYHPEDSELANRHGQMQWVNRIEKAYQENRFCLYAQPIQALDHSAKKHYEILIRMRDEQGNIVPPGAFLPAAERYNLIQKLDKWVIAEVFKQLKDHPSFVDQIDFISINLSGSSLVDEQILEFIILELERSGVESRRICFEVTETVAISNLAAANRFIAALREVGCRFALDDFGSGISSFGYLKNFPVDYIKIDGMFVKDMIHDPIDYAMVKSIHEIGQVMQLGTIAEFVENDAIKEAVRKLGINYAQGYGIGKPVPFETLFDE